jgi:hypothetical protein
MKITGRCESGCMAKTMITEGRVTVEGKVEREKDVRSVQDRSLPRKAGKCGSFEKGNTRMHGNE